MSELFYLSHQACDIVTRSQKSHCCSGVLFKLNTNTATHAGVPSLVMPASIPHVSAVRKTTASLHQIQAILGPSVTSANPPAKYRLVSLTSSVIWPPSFTSFLVRHLEPAPGEDEPCEQGTRRRLALWTGDQEKVKRMDRSGKVKPCEQETRRG